MHTTRFALVATAVLVLAGCDSGTPVGTQGLAPRFDGSGMVGSGNRDGTTTTTTSDSDSTSTGRGPGMVGSGN